MSDELSAQEQYDMGQVEKYGGSCGDFTTAEGDDGEAYIVPRAAPPVSGEPAGEVYQGEQYDPELHYDPALDVVEPAPYYEEYAPESYTPQPPDPFSETYAADMEAYLDARDAQRFEPVGFPEHEQWAAEREAEQGVRQAAAEVANIEQGNEGLRQVIDEAAGGLDRYPPEFGGEVATQMAAISEELVADLVNMGYSSEQVWTAMEQHMPDIAKAGVDAAREARFTESWKAELKQHFGRRA